MTLRCGNVSPPSRGSLALWALAAVCSLLSCTRNPAPSHFAVEPPPYPSAESDAPTTHASSEPTARQAPAEPRNHDAGAPTPVGLTVPEGKATYYSSRLAGRKTASGQTYDPAKLTAAHRKLPFGTRVKVTRVDTGRSVVVTINDRGPFGVEERIIDLSFHAAELLDMVKRGVVPVRLEVVPEEP
jgi:rare lipoprotein A